MADMSDASDWVEKHVSSEGEWQSKFIYSDDVRAKFPDDETYKEKTYTAHINGERVIDVSPSSHPLGWKFTVSLPSDLQGRANDLFLMGMTTSAEEAKRLGMRWYRLMEQEAASLDT